MLGGRSFNYPDQYPIFPYILKGCNEENFDLTDDSMYRDLTLPTIKLNHERFAYIIDAYTNGGQTDSLIHKTPMNGYYTSRALVRVEPFTTLQIEFTGSMNKFDTPDRQFYSIPQLMYDSIYNENGDNYSEIIPEFFSLPIMMLNENKFNFGKRRHDPQGPIDNVILPPWCQFKENANDIVGNSQLLHSYIFTSVSRIALEGVNVSKNLHKWIDLFFTKGSGFCKNDISQINDANIYRIFEPNAYPEIESGENNSQIESDDADSQFYEELCGVLPEILFDINHIEKKKLDTNFRSSKAQQPQQFPPLKDSVISIMKEVVFIKNSSLIDIHSNSGEVSVPDTIGDLQCVVRQLKEGNETGNGCLAIFCTKSNPFIIVLDIKGSKILKTECHIGSAVTSVSSIGNRYIVTGSSDCSVSLWRVTFGGKEMGQEAGYEISLVSTSSFHSDEIVAVGGCYENGLVVSLDKKNILVFETILSKKFISFVDLNNPEFPGNKKINRVYEKTQIHVYKSGIVAVSQKERVLFFDCHGELIYIWILDECDEIFEVKKFYDFNTREILIVGYRFEQSNKISIFDLTDFKLAKTIEENYEHLCPMKKIAKIIISNGNGLSTIDFSDAIKTVISQK